MSIRARHEGARRHGGGVWSGMTTTYSDVHAGRPGSRAPGIHRPPNHQAAGSGHLLHRRAAFPVRRNVGSSRGRHRHATRVLTVPHGPLGPLWIATQLELGRSGCAASSMHMDVARDVHHQPEDAREDEDLDMFEVITLLLCLATPPGESPRCFLATNPTETQLSHDP